MDKTTEFFLLLFLMSFCSIYIINSCPSPEKNFKSVLYNFFGYNSTISRCESKVLDLRLSFLKYAQLPAKQLTVHLTFKS